MSDPEVVEAAEAVDRDLDPLGWRIQCSVCAHSGPWRRPIEDLRRAVCGKCGAKGAGHLTKRR